MSNLDKCKVNGVIYNIIGSGGTGTGWTDTEIALLKAWGKTLVYEDTSSGQALFDSLISLLEDGGGGGGGDTESTSYTTSLNGTIMTLTLNGDETSMSASVSNNIMTATVS